MNTLKEQIGNLGISHGTALFVHCSLKAIGPNVRAEELIFALRAAIGDEGTLLLPTFTSHEEECFDPGTTPSVMGAVAEVFRKMPGTLRSRHPRHPVAAQGPAAKELLKGHERAIGPCGTGTPFEKHARCGGQVLLIGVDLDTLTLLHTAEAHLDLPYLNEMEGAYIDADGCVRYITMHQTPGGHRGGVRLFERILRRRGLIKYGRIGNAHTILMDAGKVLDVMIEVLKADPAAALCRGDYCPDCVTFKAKIRSKQLEEFGASLSIVLPEMPKNPHTFRELLERSGCSAPFGLASSLNIVHLNTGCTPPPPPDNKHEWILQPAPQDLMKFTALPAGYAGFAFAPLEAANAGIQPFYDVLYRAKCRDYVTDIFVEDGLTCLKGFFAPPLGYVHELVPSGRVALGDGHAQLCEILSAMRMRSFSGRYHLIVPEGNLYAETLRLLKEFFNLLP